MEPAKLWSPDDENSLPTVSDRILAVAAINVLKHNKEKILAKGEELKQELVKLQAEADQIEREIFKRTSWIASVRRVPPEILSLVFVEVCKVDWKSPLALGAVCRRWRYALLGTPQAWSFIGPNPNLRPFHHKLLSLWLSRCGPLKLHISLSPSANHEAASAVCRHEKNIQCLSIFSNMEQLGRRFTELKGLRLGPEDRRRSRAFGNQHSTTSAQEREEGQSAETPCILDVERFPKLVSLHVHSPSLSLMKAIARESSFPPLQELHIHVRGPHWLSIIRYCAGSLSTLAIEYTGYLDNTASTEDISLPVTMPRLRNLHYVVQSVEMGPDVDEAFEMPFPILRTPSLQAYHENNAYITTPMHRDVSSITSLFLHQPLSVSWRAFPRLMHLQVCDYPKGFKNSISRLKGNVAVCPDLAVVEYIPLAPSSPLYEQRANLLFRERGEMTGKLIDFKYLPFEDSPKRLGYSACYTFCKCDFSSEDGQQDLYQERSYVSQGDTEDASERDDEDDSSDY